MTKEQMFYKAIDGKEYRIFKTQYDYYITTIEDGENTDDKVWVFLDNAQKYISNKIEENRNKKVAFKATIKAIDPQPCENCAIRTDVIEQRAKVNKTIEELQNMKVHSRTRTARLVSLPEVLDIIKRNLGG